MALFLKTFPVGRLQCNCSIVADTQTREAIIIDPGDEAPRILQQITEHQLRVVAIVHTHAHIDHIGAACELHLHTKAPTYLHNDDLFLHQMLDVQAQFLNIPTPMRGDIHRSLHDAQSIAFGEHTLGVLHTPGHTPGSTCFTVDNADLCFSGDTLFLNSIGRSDLWGGDAHALKHSIQHKLYALNSATRVITGHGPDTSIDREKRTNPFVRG